MISKVDKNKAFMAWGKTVDFCAINFFLSALLPCKLDWEQKYCIGYGGEFLRSEVNICNAKSVMHEVIIMSKSEQPMENRISAQKTYL